MAAVKNILADDETIENDENVQNGAKVRTNSNPNLTMLETRGRASMRPTRSDPRLSGAMTPGPRKTVAVVNLRHRRSKSTDADLWLDHRPTGEKLTLT